MERICETCGKKFNIKPWAVKVGRGKFCSKKCHGLWRSKYLIGEKSYNWQGGKRIKICKNCSNPFELDIRKFKKGLGLYCSSKCYGLAIRKGIKKNCLLCGESFEARRCEIKKGWGQFCSKNCKGVYFMAKRPYKATPIERKIERELVTQNIPYKRQVIIPIARTIIDFLLPNKTVIYCDGGFHQYSQIKKRDQRQELSLKTNGYKVFRFNEKEINESARKCVQSVAYLTD